MSSMRVAHTNQHAWIQQRALAQLSTRARTLRTRKSMSLRRHTVQAIPETQRADAPTTTMQGDDVELDPTQCRPKMLRTSKDAQAYLVHLSQIEEKEKEKNKTLTEVEKLWQKLTGPSEAEKALLEKKFKADADKFKDNKDTVLVDEITGLMVSIGWRNYDDHECDVVVAFRGSRTGFDWWQNIFMSELVPAPLNPDLGSFINPLNWWNVYMQPKVHGGFFFHSLGKADEIFKEVKDILEHRASRHCVILLSGHSLGAGCATALARAMTLKFGPPEKAQNAKQQRLANKDENYTKYAKVFVVAMACPRTGDVGYCQQVNRFVDGRVVYENDIVTYLPFAGSNWLLMGFCVLMWCYHPAQLWGKAAVVLAVVLFGLSFFNVWGYAHVQAPRLHLRKDPADSKWEPAITNPAQATIEAAPGFAVNCGRWTRNLVDNLAPQNWKNIDNPFTQHRFDQRYEHALDEFLLKVSPPSENTQ